MIVKLGFSPEQFFDDEGIPLAAGRITLTAHGSDIPIPVYSRQGDVYVQAANPIITAGDGRIETVFFDASIIDVRVEKRLEDGSYEPLDTYQYGMDVPAGTDSTRVIGIEALKDVDPSVSIVTVIGYNDATDAPERMYIWDSHCTALADNGCVVESNSGQSGRWLLVWADEKLPCSVYGIKPGVDESNINAFLNYQLVVGTYSIHMPPLPRFLKGTYGTTATLTTGKTLYFDVDAKFNTVINCKSAIVEPGASYVADFVFTKQDVALAAWFKTARAFFTCGANVLRYGLVDHFADSSITNPVHINSKTIEGSRRLVLSYSNGAYLHIDNCAVSGKGLFNPSLDYLKFSNMAWNQDWFTSSSENLYDFGLVSHNNHIEYVSTNNDSMELDNFPVTEIYLKMRIANETNSSSPDRKLYLQGRTIANIGTSVFSEIHDAVVTGSVYLTGPTNSMLLDNVKARTGVYIDAKVVEIRNSEIRFGGGVSPIDSLVVYDSVIDSPDVVWTRDTAITVVGGRWSVVIVVADDDTTYPKAVSFEDCKVSFSADVAHKRLSFKDCEVSGGSILVYPWGSGTSYYTGFTAVGCIFDLTGHIHFDKHPSDDDADTIHDVVPNLVMLDNNFVHQGKGMWMRYWSSITNETFYIVQSTSEITFNLLGGKLLYRNNEGYCPQDSFDGIYSGYVEKYVYYPTNNGEQVQVFVANSYVHCVPKFFESRLYNYSFNANRPSFWSHNLTGGNMDYSLTWVGNGAYIRHGQLAQGIIDIGSDLHGDANNALEYVNTSPVAGGGGGLTWTTSVQA